MECQFKNNFILLFKFDWECICSIFHEFLQVWLPLGWWVSLLIQWIPSDNRGWTGVVGGCGLSGPFQVLCDGDAKKIKLTDLLSWGSVDVNGCTISAWLPEVHNQLFGVVDIEGNVVILTPPCQTADLDYISSVFIHDDDESSVASSTYFVKTLELGLALQSRLYRKQRSRLMQCNWV